jgi:hypothetical protein
MTFNKKILPGLAFSAIIMTSHLAMANSEVRNPMKSTGKKPEIMIFQHADKGTITKEANESSCYQVNLSGLKDHVIYFANQPSRSTGVLNLSEFVVTWQHNEKVDNIHPNAIIHGTDSDKKTRINDTVVLSNLKYDAKNNTITYKACALDPKKMFAKGKITDVSVFIDPFHIWP